MRKSFTCSICEKQVSYEGSLPALYPFCSERCKLIDLHRWFTGQYRIDRDLTPDDLAEDSPPPPPADG